MQGFIVDQTYRIEHGKAYVYLFGRLENGASFCTVSHYRPYFCIRKDDIKKAEKLPTTIAYGVEQTPWKSLQEEPLAKVVYDIPKDTVPLRKLFEEHRIPCFEADIRFTQRFLMDHGILRSVEIEGSYDKGTHVDRVYREPTLASGDWYPALRTLSFDIETSPDAKALYSISIVCTDSKRSEVLIVSERTDLKRARSFPDEKSLLTAFTEAVREIDPDILTGWNMIDFDLAVLRDKFRQHDVPFRLGRWDWDCTLRIESSFLKESTADFPGRQVLDGIQMLKLNFIQLDNYKLATAANVFLGEGKLIGETNKGEAITDAFENDQQKLVDYNLKDSQLVLDIIAKTNALDIMISRAMLTGMPLDRVRGSIASFDSLYLRELRKRGYAAPSGGFADKEERIGGGFVKESVPGIYDNILVLDFKSLYPSIMRTFNIDPASFEKGKDAKDPANAHKWIVAPNKVVFSSEEGILPSLLQRLWKARDTAKKGKDQYASFAIKILMNSFFGVLASPACRFFSLDMANAITSFGRHMIRETAHKIEEMGYDVIYGDTDSVFVDAHTKDPQEAERIAKSIARKINHFYKQHISETYKRESFMELEPEKVFVRFIMPKVRDNDQGAKKRYAGIVVKDGKRELVVTGLEMVRRDWTELAKSFQEEILQLVFAEKRPDVFIRGFVDDLRKGKMDDRLVYAKAVRKDLDKYTKTTPPHVKAARLLEERGGKLTSNVVEYVMTVDGPWPVDLDDRPTTDYEHYIDKQLEPIANAVLVFYGTNFDDVLKSSRQTTLGGYGE